MHNFDEIVERRGTNSLKYDFAAIKVCPMIYCLSGWLIWILSPHPLFSRLYPR